MRNVKTWGILFLCLLLLPGVAYAQKRQIEGTVISQEDKEPLIGATVIVKGRRFEYIRQDFAKY